MPFARVVIDSMGETIRRAGLRVADQVVDRLASVAAGYPFTVQLVGYDVWQVASRRGLGHGGLIGFRVRAPT